MGRECKEFTPPQARLLPSFLLGHPTLPPLDRLQQRQTPLPPWGNLTSKMKKPHCATPCHAVDKAWAPEQLLGELLETALTQDFVKSILSRQIFLMHTYVKTLSFSTICKQATSNVYEG